MMCTCVTVTLLHVPCAHSMCHFGIFRCRIYTDCMTYIHTRNQSFILLQVASENGGSIN